MIYKSTYNPQEFDIYIGNDVDKKSFCLTVRDRQRILMTKKIPSSPENLYNFIRHSFTGSRVVVGYESGPTGYGLYDYLSDRNQMCVMIAPTTIERPANARVKTNRIDAAKLTTMLTDGHFNPIRVPEGPYRELRELSQARVNYAQDVRITKQRIKSLLLYYGLSNSCPETEKGWSRSAVKELQDLDCPETARFKLNLLLEDLGYRRQKLLTVTRHLRRFIRSHQEISEYVHYLVSIPGIGIVTASAVLGRIGDPANLRNLQELGAFIGLVPKENSSGDNVHRSSITKTGNRSLRSLLIEAAWSSIQHDKELNQFYYRIKSRHHPSIAARKAIVAVARKLTLRIYSVLKQHRTYIVH